MKLRYLTAALQQKGAQMIKFVHIADLHLDSPFSGADLNERRERRAELRKALVETISFCTENKTDILLVAGDLFDGEFAGRDTAAFVAECFSRIPDTRVFIAPGNHDHFGAHSPYRYCDFSPNVHIFTEETLSCVEIPQLGCAVYGYGFNSEKMSAQPTRGIHPHDTDRINILVGHGDLDVSHSPYYNISSEDLAASGLDYVALGHIHKPSGLIRFGGTACAYSGCLVGRDYGESGMRGLVTGTVSKTGTEIEYVPVSRRSYEEITVDVTGKSPSEVLSELQEKCMGFSELTGVRTVLIGERDDFFTLPKSTVEKALSHIYAVHISDKTTEVIGYERLLSESSLKGHYARMLRQYIESDSEEMREKAMLALRYGLEALRK